MRYINTTAKFFGFHNHFCFEVIVVFLIQEKNKRKEHSYTVLSILMQAFTEACWTVQHQVRKRAGIIMLEWLTANGVFLSYSALCSFWIWFIPTY